ncbi:MAG: sigma-70 family RNA polymerase sigma factor [Clostridia bacterium]|nr:sigma-70 family RNA polymerase sigma factor [Clostridia bacterium]
MNSENSVTENCLSDEEIIDLYWKREERAIAQTDAKYGRYLFKIAYNILHDRPDCEECLNDTYLGTWNRIPPARPNAFQIFLSKIMRNIAVDRFRRKSAKRKIPSSLMTSLEELDECVSYEPSVEESYAIEELKRLLNAYLRSLSDRDATVFICRYYYADSLAEIAEMLGVSERTVNRILLSLRVKLKELLDKEGYAHV